MIDFLYIVSLNENDKEAFERFKCSVESVLNNTYKDIRICVSDISKTSIENQIRKIIPVPYSYAHKSLKGKYNRSFNANFGFKQLVKTKIFVLSDIDIIYKSTHIEECLKMHNRYKVFAYTCFRMQEKFYSSNYSECLKKKGTYISFGGGFLCDSELFRRLKGFDESYICWGGEDSQFFDRAARICKILRPSKKVITIHLWHEPFDKDKHIYEQRNREKYQKDKQRFKFGNENPCNINKGGWG